MRVIRYDELADYIASGKDFILELGEQNGIGSSSLLVQICGKLFLLDRGSAFEGTGVNKHTLFPVGDVLEGIHIDAIFLSHVHLDHAGYIPPVVLAHPEARFVLSSKTLEELKITLEDTLNIQIKEADKAHYLGLPEPTILFTEEQVSMFLNETDSYEIVDTDNEDVCLTWDDFPGWKFGFTSSGHIKGAFWSFIITPENDCITSTGDICSHDQENKKGVLMPNEIFLKKMGFGTWRRTILITEATNGNRDRKESWEDMDSRMKAEIEATFDRGGMVLCPVFMIGKGPNIVAKLARMGFRVFVAGGVRKTIFTEIEPMLLEKWMADKTVMLAIDGPGRKQQMDAVLAGEYGPMVIVCSSATLDQGASTGFAIRMLPMRKNLLISTGHRFTGSKMEEVFKVQDQPLELGRTIVFESIDRFGNIVKTPVNFRCGAIHCDNSSHDYREGLVARAIALNASMVLVKHCTEEGFQGFESGLKEALGDKCPSITHVVHMQVINLV